MKSVDEYCEVLGIDSTATLEEFKQAYRDLAKVWHPDRFAHDPRLQRKAEEKLKEINDAYQHLQTFFSDTSQRGSRSANASGSKSDGDQQKAQESAHTPPPDPEPSSTKRERTGWVKKLRSRISSNTLSFLVAILAFVAVHAVRSVMNADRAQQAAIKAENVFEQLQADAIKKHPDIPRLDAIQQEANERATEKLTSETDELKRANTAADMFWGFYFINARERLDFCRENGVDIQPFVQSFEHAHINEIAKARSIYTRTSVHEEELYTLIKTQLRKALLQDMRDISKTNGFSVAETCQFFSKNADALVQEMLLSKVQPVVYKVLTSAK